MDADETAGIPTYSLFSGETRIAIGDLEAMATAAQAAAERDGPIIVFSNATGRVVDLDPRGPAVAHTGPSSGISVARPGRGRPKLGVVPREVTLLPRHWDWLQSQPGGASAALRRLVDQARRDGADSTRRREARESAHRAMTTLAGNLEGYEDALRALYAGEKSTFGAHVATWPGDIRTFVEELASGAWSDALSSGG